MQQHRDSNALIEDSIFDKLTVMQLITRTSIDNRSNLRPISELIASDVFRDKTSLVTLLSSAMCDVLDCPLQLVGRLFKACQLIAACYRVFSEKLITSTRTTSHPLGPLLPDLRIVTRRSHYVSGPQHLHEKNNRKNRLDWCKLKMLVMILFIVCTLQ